jgi:hypothetical protein
MDEALKEIEILKTGGKDAVAENCLCPSGNGLFARFLRYAQNFILGISTICRR